mgnify:CR=1 FL=1
MKMRILLLFILFANSFFSQSQFHFRYGTSFKDESQKVIQTKDGNFVVVGQTNGFGSAGNAFMMKINPLGAPLWIKDYSGINTDKITDIIELVDNNLVVCGNTGSFGAGNSDGFIMKTDSLGNMVWAKAYGNILGDFFYRISSDGSNGFFVAAYAQDSVFNEGASVLRLDSDGNILWTKWINTTVNVGLDMTPISSGGVLLCVSPGSSGPDFSCWKFSNTGTLMWSGKYTSNPTASSGLAGISILENSVGEILVNFSVANPITLAKSLDNCVMKLSSTGNILWYKSYGGIYGDWSKTISNTNDGGIVLCGFTNSAGNGDYDACLIKLDYGGNINWAKAYGTVWYEEPSNSFQTLDKGFIMTGLTFSYGSGTDSTKIHLVKTDSIGNSSCNSITWTPLVVSQNANLSSALPVNNFSLKTNTIMWATNNRAFYNKNICNLSGIYSIASAYFDFKIYPNPNNGSFQIQIEKEIENCELVLFNSIGQKVYEQKISQGENKINSTNLSVGLYPYVLLKNKQLVSRGKLSIE